MSDIIVLPQVVVKDNKTVTTSLEVARVFKKRHNNILRDIENLKAEIPNDFHELNFEFVEIIEKNAIKGNVVIKSYNMTRDGFTLLAMGFTGKKAMQFKIAYIQAFNAMENQLKTVAGQFKAGEQIPEDVKQCEKFLSYFIPGIKFVGCK